jgi:hypothetical protein
MFDGALRRAQLIELVLGEEGDLEFRRLGDFSVHGLQPPGNQLGEGRFAVAVGAEQGNPVVGVDVECEPLQDLLAVIAGGDVFKFQDRRGEPAFRIGEMDRPAAFLGERCDRFHLLQHLQPRLRLACLGRLGAEPVDEGLQMLALFVLLFLGFLLQDHLFPPLTVETVITAAVEGQLALVEMGDAVDRIVQKVAVVRDQYHLVRIAGDIVFQPERAFQVEIVGGLVEKQEVGFRKEHRSQCDAHAPAAGKGRARAFLCVRVEAEAGEDRACARFCRVAADIGEPRMYIGNACRICFGFCFRKQFACVRCRRRAPRRSRLCSVPGASCATWPIRADFGIWIRAGFGRQFAGDES